MSNLKINSNSLKILYLTDTHISAKGFSGRVDDIQDTILNKFSQIKKIINDEKIDLVIHGGDMFNTADISNKFTGEVAKVIKDWNVPVYVTPGNHDVYGQNVITIQNTKLGLLESTGIIKLLDRSNPLMVEFKNKNFMIEGQEYNYHLDSGDISEFRINKSDFNILVTHSMLVDKPFFDKYTLINDVVTDADIVLSGHYHPGFKEVYVNNTMFFNPGSTVRVENTVENASREPKILILDLDVLGNDINLNYEYKILKTKENVFKEKRVKAESYYSNSLDTFKSKIDNANLFGLDILQCLDNEKNPSNLRLNNIIDNIKDEVSKIKATRSVDKGFIPSKDMVFINKVEIKNFQKHKKLTVDLTKGFNVITGESNVGKTAILRAIYWVLYNKPNKSNFITTNEKSVSVTLHLSNGYSVTRKRTLKSAGSYILVKPDGTKEEYKGFNNNIPIEIINATQMPEVDINGNKYRFNVSTQLEGPFLVSNGPSEKMSMISALVDAEKLDEIKSKYRSEKLNLSKKEKELNEDIKNREEYIKNNYSNLSKRKSGIDFLETVIKNTKLTNLQCTKLESLNNNFISVKATINNIEKKLNSIEFIDNDTIDELNNNITFLEKLCNINNKLKSLTKEKDDIEKELSFIPDTKGLSEVLESVTDKILLLDKISKIKEKHNTTKDSIDKCNKELNLIPDLDNIEDMLSKVLEDVNKLDGVKKICNNYNKVLNEINLLKAKYDEIKDVDVTYDVEYLIENVDVLSSLSTLFKDYNVNSDNISKIKDEITYVDEKINETKKLYDDIINDFNKNQHICEYCGSVIDINKMINM